MKKPITLIIKEKLNGVPLGAKNVKRVKEIKVPLETICQRFDTDTCIMCNECVEKGIKLTENGKEILRLVSKYDNPFGMI